MRWSPIAIGMLNDVWLGDRVTLADWIGRAAWWLAPLAQLIGTTVMTQPVLHTDDTPIRTLAPGTGKTRLSRFWVYAVDPRSHAGAGPPAAFYRYSADRKGERPREHLAGFSGVMHADAFAGYDALYRSAPGQPPRIQHAACWAHARRKLFEVHESTKSPIAEEALRRIQALYQIEADITGRPATDRQAERQLRSKPLLDDLKTWMEAQRRRASSKTALGKALRYALGRWEALTRYADDGRLAIDNNVAERLMRGIAVTRKNFLFLGSDKGGDRAAVLYTLIETAKLNGVTPRRIWPTPSTSSRVGTWLPGSANSCPGIARTPLPPGLPENPSRLPWGSAYAYRMPHADAAVAPGLADAPDRSSPADSPASISASRIFHGAGFVNSRPIVTLCGVRPLRWTVRLNWIGPSAWAFGGWQSWHDTAHTTSRSSGS